MPTPANAGNVFREAAFATAQRTENVNYTIDSGGPDQLIRSQLNLGVAPIFSLVDVTANDGRILTFKDLSNSAGVVFVLRPVGGQTINAVAGDFSFSVAKGAVTIRGDAGSLNWDVVSEVTAATSGAPSVFNQQYIVSATNIFSGTGIATGLHPVTISGVGGGGAGGGGAGGVGAGLAGTGGGGGGGGILQEITCMVDFSHRIDAFIAAQANGGTAGAGAGGAGGNGVDGGSCYLLDFTTSTVIAAFAGGSGGQGAVSTTVPGLGGANYPPAQWPGTVAGGNPGFLAAGGHGGQQSVTVPTAGNFNSNSQNRALDGAPGAVQLYAQGAAGTNGGVTQGGGGGGGGAGPLGAGTAGGNGNAGTGTIGTDGALGTGAGSGGGGGGQLTGSSAGSRGGIGGGGSIEVTVYLT